MVRTAKAKTKVKAVTSDIRESLIEQNGGDNLLFLDGDGLDECIIGLAGRNGMDQVVAYDYEKMVEAFMRQGMSYDEAVEHISFNIEGAWVGDLTPIIVYNKRE